MNHDERKIQCYHMLLRIAGFAPDDLLTQCRHWLAADHLNDIARAVAHAALTLRVRVPETDLDLLAEMIAESGPHPSALALMEVADPDRAPAHDFTATKLLADAVLYDLIEVQEAASDPDREAEPEDGVCVAALEAIATEPSATALWRAWRFPAARSPWPSPRRIYIIETDANADLIGLTARLQQRLRAAGEVSPQVEAYVTGAELPPYQRYARASAALLWARTPDPGIQIAMLFDGMDSPDQEPTIDSHYPRVDDAEREHLLAYLSKGEPVLLTDERMPDLVDPSAVNGVPLNILTDGHWIWTDAATYYLDRHGLRPDPALVEHIRQRGYHYPRVDGAAVHRALRALSQIDGDYQIDGD